MTRYALTDSLLSRSRALFWNPTTRYEKALGFLQEALIYTFLTDERKADARAKRLLLWNNEAMCYLKLSRWSEARRQVAKVLGCDEDCPVNSKRGKLSEDQKAKGMSMQKLPIGLKAKALFRRALAYEGVGEFEKSEVDFREVINLQVQYSTHAALYSCCAILMRSSICSLVTRRRGRRWSR
jgi:tetratricopeptide (TPR) repeat protein